jgi:hypothetical protein
VALTHHDLNRATLARQMVLQRTDVGVVDAVRRVMALQAQEPASPYVALWNRVAGFDPVDLDAALMGGDVVKGSLMRITLHAVAADDHPVFHEALLPLLRAARLNDRRFKATGLSPDAADALIPRVAALGSDFGRDEAETAIGLDEETSKWVWWAMRTYGPFVHAPGDAPWSFGPRPVYRAAPTGERPSHHDAMRFLAQRYLAAFGPAGPEDLARFTLHRRSTTRTVLEGLEDLVTMEGPDGRTLYDLPGAPLPGGDAPVPPRLLGMWDSMLFAYADRSRVIPDEYRSDVIRRNGDSLPTLLVDGRVAGVWRQVHDGIEATAFRRLSAAEWEGLEVEAARLLDLLAGRDTAVYGRYARWWDRLPGGTVRLLGNEASKQR